MNDSRFEMKVGLFVFIGLAVMALLVLNFSKGITLFKSTYEIHVIMPTVAGLKPAADVMMAGVPVGKVASTRLSLDGRSVDITVKVLAKYQIHKDARFHIDALGFLGDQYVEVTPAEGDLEAESKVPLLTNGETITGETPLNMQEAVRSISDFVGIGQQTMRDIDKAVSNVNNTILAVSALTNFVGTMTNLGALTEEISATARQVHGILDTNASSIQVAITNIAILSRKMEVIADSFEGILRTNTGDVMDAVRSVKDTSAELKRLADGLQAGQGVLGGLLKDDQMRTNFATLLVSLNGLAQQFTQFGERLNDEGIWRSLWKPKSPPTNAPKR